MKQITLDTFARIRSKAAKLIHAETGVFAMRTLMASRHVNAQASLLVITAKHVSTKL